MFDKSVFTHSFVCLLMAWVTTLIGFPPIAFALYILMAFVSFGFWMYIEHINIVDNLWTKAIDSGCSEAVHQYYLDTY